MLQPLESTYRALPNIDSGFRADAVGSLPDQTISRIGMDLRRATGSTKKTAILAMALLCCLHAGEAVNAREDEPVADAPAATAADAAPDPVTDLEQRRDNNRTELERIARDLAASSDRNTALEKDIAALAKNTATLKQQLVDAATRRKNLEDKIADGEERLAKLGQREDGVRASLRERRGVLAEVLAALQRMGRNPPPALLVTPEDALASVRSAILLGAVVPGIRKETDRLAADLQELADLRHNIATERDQLAAMMAESFEESRRIDLLVAENDRLEKRSAAELQDERRRSAELAAKATSLEGLIGSLEAEISSVREARLAAKAEEERLARLSDEERERARALAEQGVPDKNRIAPAYPFANLKNRLHLPVSGTLLRRFGEADGTGHTSRGLVMETAPSAVVTAPADGFVVFAGEFRSYGRMVILNAGDGYHIVMTGMDNVRVRQGMFVFSGEPVATMGEKRVASAAALALETNRPTLYIEFRKDGVPVDSRPWWTVKDFGRANNDT